MIQRGIVRRRAGKRHPMHSVKQTHPLSPDPLAQPFRTSRSGIGVPSEPMNLPDRDLLPIDGKSDPQPDGDDRQRDRGYANPQRPRQADRDAAGLGSDVIGGGHAVSLPPLPVGMNANDFGTPWQVNMTQALRQLERKRPEFPSAGRGGGSGQMLPFSSSIEQIGHPAASY